MERSYQNGPRYWIFNSKIGPSSIRNRLLIAKCIVLIAIWAGAAFFTKQVAFQQSRDFLSLMAAADTELVLAFVSNSAAQINPPEISDNRTVALWKKDRLIWETNSVSKLDLSEFRAGNIDAVHNDGDHNWVVSSRCIEEDCVTIAIRDTERKFAIRKLVASIFGPLLLVILASLAATYVAIKIGLKPLDKLADDLNSIDLDRLQTLPKARYPIELQSLAGAINTLSNRVRDQLNKERSFLDACAHEIRTPLTGLTSQVQSLLSKNVENIPRNINEKLGHIERSAMKTARIANQLLGLARSNNTLADNEKLEEFELTEVVRLVLSDFLLANEEIDIELSTPDSLKLKGDPFGIELLVQNLIDNAIKHGRSTEKTKILVTLESTKAGAEMSIEDNGQSPQNLEYDRLTDRFSRYSTDKEPSKVRSTGAGLGLSIVKEVVSSWHGQLSFGKSNKLGGFRVHISLPSQRHL